MADRGNFGSFDGSGFHSQVRDSGNDFNRLMQAVGNNVQKITQNVAQLQRLISQIGTSQDSPDLREKLHQVQHYTNQLAKDTNKMMKDISHLPQPSSQSEQKQRKMQKERLMNEFSTALNNFQTTQRHATMKEKESLARAREHQHSSYDPFVDERQSDDQLTTGHQHPQSIQMEENIDLSLLREREDAIRKLESDIVDVNQIFKDLGTMVHEQGEMIDSIEANVEDTQTRVEQGTRELAKAREYQSKARRKKCICIIVLVLVLLIVAIILGVTLSNRNQN